MITIGHKDGKTVRVSINLIHEFGVKQLRKELGLTRKIPFKTGFSVYDVVLIDDVEYENQVEANIKKQIEASQSLTGN